MLKRAVRIICCNPFGLTHSKVKSPRKLRNVKSWMLVVSPKVIQIGEKICIRCAGLLSALVQKKPLQSPHLEGRQAGTEAPPSNLSALDVHSGYVHKDADVSYTPSHLKVTGAPCPVASSTPILKAPDTVPPLLRTSQASQHSMQVATTDVGGRRSARCVVSQNVRSAPYTPPKLRSKKHMAHSQAPERASSQTRLLDSLESSASRYSPCKIISSRYTNFYKRVIDYELTQKMNELRLTENTANISSSNKGEIVSDIKDKPFILDSYVVEELNKALPSVGETPINPLKLKSQNYRHSKVQKISYSVLQTLAPQLNKGNKINADKFLCNFVSIFKKVNNRIHQIQLLTLLPTSWLSRQIEKLLNVKKSLVKKARQLSKQKGPLATPNPKPGKPLSDKTVQTVTEFYLLNHISRPMPGINDYITIKTVKDGKVEKYRTQKQLCTGNLKEIHVQYIEHIKDKPEHKVSFSKFCSLRPKQCVLAGDRGTHSVCVCDTHQNFKLMIDGSHLNTLSKNKLYKGHTITSYKDCLPIIICKNPSDLCYLNECDRCPGVQPLIDHLENMFDENLIESVTCKQWLLGENKRCSLETVTKPLEEFLNYFATSLEKILTHSYINKKQTNFVINMKKNLKPGEFLTQCDFSENYKVVVQNSIQSFYWTNVYITIHPFITYYVENGVLKHITHIMVSECNDHDTCAVYLFQTRHITLLKKKIGAKNIKKIHYLTDGAGSQYKNRHNFINLTYHKEDFGINAEFHFHCTSHGKTGCDGVGGTVKRMAYIASLQCDDTSKQILTALDFYKFSCEHSPHIHFDYCSQEDYDRQEIFLGQRFADSKRIPDTRKFHCIQPQEGQIVRARYISSYDKY